MPIGHTPEPSGLLDRAYRFVTRIGSRLPNARDRVPPPAELEKFRTAQRTAYECVTQVATRMREGSDIGWPGGGAKFEELLVVEPHRAWWLDDDVPHMGVA
ncbi:MAG: hypothetical protein JNM17_34365 [Archangium sp.]|nr:hypothetical protein [Archangium sp.]